MELNNFFKSNSRATTFTAERTEEQMMYLDVDPSLVTLVKSAQAEQEWTESIMNKTLFSSCFVSSSINAPLILTSRAIALAAFIALP